MRARQKGAGVLTPRHLKMISLIDESIFKTGVAPTYEAMLEPLGLSAKSGIFRMVNYLVREGYLERPAGRHQSLKVLRHPASSPIAAVKALLDEIDGLRFTSGAVSARVADVRAALGEAA